MRPIKFRAWDKKTKEMVFAVELISFADGSLSISQPLLGGNTDDFELMQFTGLLDKSGVEIYEGDILLEEDDGIAQGCVTFDNGKFEITLYTNKECTGFLQGRLAEGHCLGRYTLSERLFYRPGVIGNIYENPELLQHDHGPKSATSGIE